MAMNPHNAIVRILNDEGETEGTGFFCGPERLIVTCAHVIEGGRGPISVSKGDSVRLCFYSFEKAARLGDNSERVRQGCAVYIGEVQSISPSDILDIALLKVNADPSLLDWFFAEEGTTHLETLPIGDSYGTVGKDFSTFGFPMVKIEEGTPGQCHIIGPSTEGKGSVLAFTSNDVSRGFSGAPVWDRDRLSTVGMIVSIIGMYPDPNTGTPRPLDPHGKQIDTGYLIPSETLLNFYPSFRNGQEHLYGGFEELDKEKNPPLSRFDDSRRISYFKPYQRYNFKTLKTDLVGTAEYEKRLNEFVLSQPVENPFNVLWWKLTGPAGSGKSRLALDLCTRLASEKRWHTGFLSSVKTFNWSSWEITRPTLVVVDYATTHPQWEATALVEVCSNNTSGYPIRFLFVDRNPIGPGWEDRVCNAGGDRNIFDSCSYEREDLPHTTSIYLSGLGDLALEVVRNELIVLGKDPALADQLSFRSAWEKADPKRRPLFALFAAHALSQGYTQGHWSPDGLAEIILENERRHWIAAGIDGLYLNALVLATMMGSVSKDMLYGKNRPDIIRHLLPKDDDDMIFDTLASITDTGSTDDGCLSKMTPDIIGELLVLSRLAGGKRLFHDKPKREGETSAQDTATRTAELLQFAWNEAPLAVADLCRRAWQNFSISEDKHEDS